MDSIRKFFLYVREIMVREYPTELDARKGFLEATLGNGNVHQNKARVEDEDGNVIYSTESKQNLIFHPYYWTHKYVHP